MEKRVNLKIEYIDHTKIKLTNDNGDTFTSKSEELADFLCATSPASPSHQAPVGGEKWVSVADRLPTEKDADECGKVLLYRKMNKEQQAQAKSIHDWYMVKHCDSNTFWQPLPTPPTT